MPRVRLGVALLLPEPVSTEIDGLRRACGDTALGRIPPHITLVPPVNVRADQVGGALRVLRDAAAASDGPLELTLGPAATFDPATPVVYLGVDGDTGELQALRDRVFVAPLARSLTWPFVPHVTLVDGADPPLIAATVAALHAYRRDVVIDRVHLLREGRTVQGRVWSPIADAPFEKPLIIGRGGLPVELTRSRLADPEVAPLFEGTVEPDPGAVGEGEPVVIAARRGSELLGAARALRRGERLLSWHTAVTEAAGSDDVEHLLRRAALH